MDIAVRSLTCHTATVTHMAYRITQCYLPPDRGDIPACAWAMRGTTLLDLLVVYNGSKLRAGEGQSVLSTNALL